MKKAFTMLELVFVIVVIGILSMAIIPRVQTNPVREASIALVADIRYTQHLSLVNDKYDVSNTTQWYKNRWQIVFSGNTYSILSNNGVTYAKDAINQTDINATELKGVSLSLSGGCNNETVISFDHMGRPMKGDLSASTSPYDANQLITTTCRITLTNLADNLDFDYIDIEPETGYVSIAN